MMNNPLDYNTIEGVNIWVHSAYIGGNFEGWKNTLEEFNELGVPWE